MAVFTSAYKALAHGALNWDTQLDADMGTLETILLQASWSPTFGGSGSSIGTSGGSSGYTTRLGQHMTYNGRLLFGSTASWGTGGGITNINVNGVIDPNISTGHGHYFKASGGLPIPLVLVPSSSSSFSIYAVGTGGALATSTISAAPAQSDQLVFHISAILA